MSIERGSALPSSADVVVVGGGVVGAAIAFQLARLGVTDVVLLDKGEIGGRASGRSGALVRTHYPNLDEARVALAALPWFEEWPDRVGGDCGFTATGFLQMVAEPDRPTLRSNVALLQEIGVDTRLVGADQINELQPQLRLADGELAAYEPRSGYADPLATTRGFASAARRLGATVLEGVEVTEIMTAGGRVRGVRTAAGDVDSPVVLLANGSWSASLLSPLGIQLDLTPIWAQVAFFARPPSLPAGRAGQLTIIDRAHGCYLRADGEDRTLVGLSGSRRPLEDLDADHPADPKFAELARRQAALRIPALADAPSLGGRGGPLDVTPDRRMVLGPAPDVPGLYLAVGMSGGGFKKAPAIGACMAELIVDGKASSAPIEPFRPTRFAEGEPLSGAEYTLPSDGVYPEAFDELSAQGLIH